MLTGIGILALILGITTLVWNIIKKQKDAEDAATIKRAEETGRRLDKWDLNNYPKFPLPIKPVISFVVGVILIAMNGLFFWAEAGTAYAVQYPWGGDKMVKTQGLKFQGWGRTIPLSYEISIKDIITRPDEDGAYHIPASGDGIYNRLAKQWEFSDAIKAEIATAVVVGVNTEDEDVFLNMADRNRSEQKLINGRVIPNIEAALKNTCKLMDAQEYISGKASDFDRYFRDQLENGMYIVEEYYTEEGTPEVIGDTTTVRMIEGNKNTQQRRYRIARDSQGNILRDNKSNTLTQYGIVIYQAQVTGIDWERSFDERLQLQKEQVAQTQLEKQEAEKEYYRAKKEIALGESEKAAERARLEKEQIKLTIAAETEAKVAEQNLIAERKKLEVAKLAAQSKKVAADAQYYENSRLVSAGLTPQERAELELNMADVVSKNLASMNVPSMIVNGDGSGSPTESLLQMKLFNDIMNKKN